MIIDREKYISHIKDQDKILQMRRVLDKIDIVLNSHTIQTTDFLDPYERYLAKSILNRFSDIKYNEEGGILEAERQIIVIYPYYYIEDTPKGVSAIRVEGNLSGLTHKDFLGSVLSLGIKRNKVGDILVHEEYTNIVVKEEIADFILLNLRKIKNQKITVNLSALESLVPASIHYNEIRKTLSSYRLDVYISGIYNLSRQESMNVIRAGHIKVNWEPINKPSKEISIGDLVSVRGYGRSILHSVEGISKKGKIRAIIRILL